MHTFSTMVQTFLGAGASVILPFIIFIIGIIFRVKFRKAIISGITVGIGFIGINLALSILTTFVGPAAKAMSEHLGLHLTIVDVGWPGIASATWAQPIAAVMIPVIIIINLVMLALKWTKTLNIDMWNYWHGSAAAAVGYFITGNFFFGIICGSIYMIFVQKMADFVAPKVEEFYGLEGITFTTGSAQGYALLALPIGWVLDKIGLNKIDIKPETIQKRFGVFGEPMVMGVVIGALLGVLGGDGIIQILQIAMELGAVMLLMPRMVKILMEGLMPIQEGAAEFLQKRNGNRKIYLGMDAALATGSPAALSTGLLLVPITLLLAAILPGNHTLPLGDLATIPFFAALVVPYRKGNIFTSVISLAIVLVFSLYMATNFAPALTQMSHGVITFPKGASQITNFDTGGNILNWLLYQFSELVKHII